MSGEKDGLEYEEGGMIRSGSLPLGFPREPILQPNSFPDTANLQELINSSHEPAIAHEDFPGGAVHGGMNSVSWLCRYSTYQIIIRLE